MSGSPAPLLTIVDALVAELDQIESSFHRCRGHSRVDGYLPYLPTEEGCLFAIWDAWSRFLRTLVLTSSASHSLGLSGTVYVPPAPRSESIVLAELYQHRRGRSYKFTNQEPNWHDERAIADIATVLSLPNAGVIIGAVSATSVVLGPVVVSSPLSEIRTARNFAAHKNWKTFADISAFSSGFSTLSEHLRQRRSGVEAFSEWTESLGSLAAAAAQ